MIRIRRGTVTEVAERRPGLLDLIVQVDGEARPALAYPVLCGPVGVGSVVVLNTTAVELGLGTGGADFVMAVEGGAATGFEGAGHAVKLRYTPGQVVVGAAEEEFRDAVDEASDLEGMPVVAAGLHSAIAPCAIGARAVAPGARIAFVMTDGGALPMLYSDTVAALREHGLLDATITAGHAFGGDYEAVNVAGALAVARGVAGADLALVAMGPGNLGTGSRLGFALLEVAGVVNTAGALGGRPVVAPRLSFADERERHRGISHHTLTALAHALAPCEVALPTLDALRARLVRRQLEDSGALDRHTAHEVDLGSVEALLSSSPVPLRTMGRTLEEDPDAFRAAAAAGVHAAMMLAEGGGRAGEG